MGNPDLVVIINQDLCFLVDGKNYNSRDEAIKIAMGKFRCWADAFFFNNRDNVENLNNFNDTIYSIKIIEVIA